MATDDDRDRMVAAVNKLLYKIHDDREKPRHGSTPSARLEDLEALNVEEADLGHTNDESPSP